ncbi:hypothetical protein MINS_11990 [Mycolicibacterium insubricum]|nr:hypothetical protein MINS_11990 [Mycolicibacterium insubricum]
MINRATAEVHRLGYLPLEGEDRVAQVGTSGHYKLLTLHGFASRYVAAAFSLPLRWLQRKSGRRQVPAPGAGLSAATPEAGAQ